MFEAKCRDGSLLKKVLEGIKMLNDAVTFVCDQTGIRSITPDECSGMRSSLFLPPELFIEYKCDSSYKFTVSSTLLLDSLSTNRDDEVTIRMSHPYSSSISIELKNQKTGETEETTTKLLENPMELSKEPSHIRYTTTCRMESTELAKKIGRFHFFEVVNIKASLDGIAFTGENKTQTKKLKIPPVRNVLSSPFSIEMTSQVNKDFSTKCLAMFTKNTGIAGMVEMKFSEKAICIKYGIGEDDEGYLKFFLSPRIDDEMDE